MITVFEAVGHGVLVLADEGPVLQPFVELEFQELVEEGAGGIAHRGDPGFGGEVFEFVAVNAAAVVLRPEGAQGDEVFHGIAAGVVAEELDDAFLPLAAEVGGEFEKFIQQRMGRGGEGIGGEMADGEDVSAASLVSSCGDPKPMHTWCERCETVMQNVICQNAQKKPPLFPLESVLI